MPTEGIAKAASAVADRIMGRAARGTSFIRQRKTDDSRKDLEAPRVFVSAVFRNISEANTSVPWIEPFLFTPIVPTTIPKVVANEAGIRLGASEDEGRAILPGHMIDVIAPDGLRVVHVKALAGVGSDWGSWDLIDELNELCFPEGLLPDVNPDWTDPRDPRHHNLFGKVDEHLQRVGNGHAPNSHERIAAEAGQLAILRGRDWYMRIIRQLEQEATNQGAAIPFGDVESMWCSHLNIPLPAWAVRYDAGQAAPTKTEMALEKMAQFMADQATSQVQSAPMSVPQAVLDRLEQLEKQNGALLDMLAAQPTAVAPASSEPVAQVETTKTEAEPPATNQPATNRNRSR